MRWGVVGLGVVVVASLSLNLWQWRRTPEPPPRAAPHATATPGSATPLAAAAQVSPVTGSCPSQLTTLAARLAKAEQYRPPNERYERSGPAPTREPAMRGKLAQLFADAPKTWSWQLECRGDTCKLDVIGRDRSTTYDWMAKVQGGALAGQVEGMMFHAGAPTQDPVTKEPLRTQTAFLTLAGVDTVSGMEILQRIMTRFRADPRVAACATGDEGYLSLAVDLDPATRRIDVAAGGTLALTPVGVCMRGVLDAVIAAEPVPEGTRGAVLYDTVELPLRN